MNKQLLKDFIDKNIQKNIDPYDSLYNKCYRRVNTICRARINRLSYDLKYDNTKLYLIKGNKEIVIERKSKNLYWSELAYNKAIKLLEELKNEFFKESK